MNYINHPKDRTCLGISSVMPTFSQKVRLIVRKIPKGKTMTYKQVAKKAGSPKAFRAVGNILSKNFDPDIPCHRVIKSDGEIGNYNRGANNKIKILKSEGVNFIKKDISSDYFVYILECKDKTLYVGSTNDLEKRIYAHNNSKSGAHYTKIRRPVVLKYSKKCKTYAIARRKEGELKRLTRKQKIELIKSSKSKPLRIV